MSPYQKVIYFNFTDYISYEMVELCAIRCTFLTGTATNMIVLYEYLP